MGYWVNTVARLLARYVSKTDTCWIWTGSLSKTGYSKTRIGDKHLLAHRVIFEHLKGPIPEGMQLDHLCRNRACVNPDHLEIVTPTENLRRGISPSAINSRRTECVKGHPFSPQNTYSTPDGRRQCRICIKLRATKWWNSKTVRRA